MARKVGFFTDTSICIGCKACEVACKEWNGLQGNEPNLLLDSYDNTGQLDAENWRHVKFIEQVPSAGNLIGQPTSAGGQAWLMMSDVCKHCQHASCMDVCPTNAIVRTEFDTVFIQQDVCNGCRNCISACPYNVIGFSQATGTVHKCTLCYDRLQDNLMPACAKACPTQSIRFGTVDDLHQLADARLARSPAGVFASPALRSRRQGLRRSEQLLPADGQAGGLPAPQRCQRRAAGSQQPARLPGRHRGGRSRHHRRRLSRGRSASG